MNDSLKKETTLLLQRLGYSKDTSEKVTEIKTELLDALLIANKIDPNANVFTEEIVSKIKKNNEVPEDEVTPYNVMRLMEIGFSGTDSIRTLKVYVIY